MMFKLNQTANRRRALLPMACANERITTTNTQKNAAVDAFFLCNSSYSTSSNLRVFCPCFFRYSSQRSMYALSY